ncbi:zinc-binding alcohol dehydrogenase family protein [Sediminibacterium roseum]|uniref:Zinc-binding alcohol dehydrogenase family protein n=1 Tax=Sediminibacterium roseum TaxID=1978412 RepID=A0ABW9ZZF2_9BACT|nr:zinc-binding alcohol dehydrogenase family protein [Sediminibacterium roseum]NCI50558.1 zinc-binding alcohol dehydrogenase family protein [Sediminibacterium roseum]
MRVLTCTTPGAFAYSHEDEPVLPAGHTMLRIKRVGICGTDLHAFEGTQPFFSYPRILGHEIAATIEETDREDFEKGEAVTIIPYFNCGTCIACRSGKPNCCTQIRVCGVHVDGAMRDLFSVPSASLVHGRGLGFDELALVEPLAIGAHSIRRAGVKADEFVLVVGAGPIGLGVIEFARIAGANVIAMDVQENRLSFCKNHLQVPHIINAATGNATERLLAITNGDMPSMVIDATGNQKAINHSFQYLAHGGRYVLVGLQKGEISFSHPEFHKREATLMSSRNATREDFDHVMDCMKKGLVQPTHYITHRTAFENVQAEFTNWLNPANGVIKAMVSFD